MSASRKKNRRTTSKKNAKKPSRQSKTSTKTKREVSVAKPSSKPSVIMSTRIQARTAIAPFEAQSQNVFSIRLGSISGETTIGDLIVAFPRTRDVLVKHGLRFDVEEAGYLYMTLNVFSAMHSLDSRNLVQELDTASKEPPLQPPPPLRPIVAPQTT